MAEKKEYRSALRSRRLIREAFQQLLREKPFEKITVTDIVRRADINRSTFYAHYPDVRGLVEDMMNQSVTSCMQLAADMDYREIFRDPAPLLEGLLKIGMENVEIYRLLGDSDFALRQVDSIKTIFLDRAIHTLDIPEAIRSSNLFKVQINFYIGGILNTFQQWLLGNLECSTEEIMAYIGTLIVSNADTYLNWE